MRAALIAAQFRHLSSTSLAGIKLAVQKLKVIQLNTALPAQITLKGDIKRRSL
jgi:hypothetical protein